MARLGGTDGYEGTAAAGVGGSRFATGQAAGGPAGGGARGAEGRRGDPGDAVPPRGIRLGKLTRRGTFRRRQHPGCLAGTEHAIEPFVR